MTGHNNRAVVILHDIVNDFHSILSKEKLVYTLKLTKKKIKYNTKIFEKTSLKCYTRESIILALPRTNRLTWHH